MYNFSWIVFAAAGASGKNRPFIETSGKLGNASVKVATDSIGIEA